MKTKVLISCEVSAQLICAFVFAYSKIRFSHDAAHVSDQPVQPKSLFPDISQKEALCYLNLSTKSENLAILDVQLQARTT